MSDDDILAKGGTEYDIEQYAKQNGADMTTPTPETDIKEIKHILEHGDTNQPILTIVRQINNLMLLADNLQHERDEAREDAQQSWKQAEEYRRLIPTTAQAMVYHSLLMKYETSEAELTQLRKVCDEVSGELINGDEYGRALDCQLAVKLRSTLPHVIKAKGNKE